VGWGWGWGVKLTMGIMNFNLRRSQVRKMGKIVCEFFSFRSENIFLFLLFNSVEKNSSYVEKVLEGHLSLLPLYPTKLRLCSKVY